MMAATTPTLDSEALEAALEKARTAWLRDYLRDTLPHLGDSESDWTDWDASFKAFLVDRQLAEPKQQKNPITQARAAIKVAFGSNHPSLQFIGLPTEMWMEINATDRDSLDDRETRPITDPDAIAAKALDLIDNSPDWAELMLGLAIATGRRTSEVLATATFTPISDWSVQFAGQLKRHGEFEDVTFEIPTLVPAAAVIRGTARLRQLLPEAAEMDPIRINQCYGHALGQACDRLFADLIPPRSGKKNIHPQILRAAYTAIAAHWFCPNQIPRLDFRAYIEGHFDASGLRVDISSQRNYLDYAIADPDGNVDGRLGVRLPEPGVAILQFFQQRLDRIYAKQERMATTEDTKRRALSESQLQRLEALGDRFDTADLIPTLDRLLDFVEPLLDWAEGQDLPFDPDALLARFDGPNPNTDAAPLLPQLARLLAVEPQPQAVLTALASLQQQQPQQMPPAPPNDDLLRGVSAQLTTLTGQVQAVGDLVGNLDDKQQQQALRLDNFDASLQQFQTWMQQVAPALQMFSMLGQLGAASSPQAPTAAPPAPPQPPAVPQTPTQSVASAPPPPPPARSQSDPTLDARAFLTGCLQFNESAAPGDRIYISAELMRQLTTIGKKYRDAAYKDMKASIQAQHQEFNLSHWNNKDRDFAPLLAWLRQYDDSIPFR